MTLPTGTPDWTKPLQGGARRLWDVAASASIFSPLFDVTRYNGLKLQLIGTGPSATFVQVAVNFYDDAAGTINTMSWQATIRASQTLNVNVPVLGPYALINVVAVGGAPFSAQRILLVGHNGGPSSSVGQPGEVFLGGGTVTVPANTVTAITAPEVTERPAILTYYVFNTSFTIHLQAFNSAGGGFDIYVDSISAAFSGKSVPVYLPPLPLQILLDNGNAAAVSAIYSLTTARL